MLQVGDPRVPLRPSPTLIVIVHRLVILSKAQSGTLGGVQWVKVDPARSLHRRGELAETLIFAPHDPNLTLRLLGLALEVPEDRSPRLQGLPALHDRRSCPTTRKGMGG